MTICWTIIKVKEIYFFLVTSVKKKDEEKRNDRKQKKKNNFLTSSTIDILNFEKIRKKYCIQKGNPIFSIYVVFQNQNIEHMSQRAKQSILYYNICFLPMKGKFACYL